MLPFNLSQTFASGSFGLPSSVAHKAKGRCASTFDDFQLQAVCMQNEKDGYDKMQNY